MQRHAIAATWGRADLASSDMMSLETSWRAWRARQGSTAPDGLHRRLQPRARSLGIFHAQPIVLNERQAGAAAIEGS